MFYWVSRTETANRWLLFKVDSNKLKEYIEANPNNSGLLREMILNVPDNVVFCIDLDNDIQPELIVKMSSENLSEKYLPEK